MKHFVFGFHGYEPSEDVVKLIREYHVGFVVKNIILFKRNIQSIPQLHQLILSLQKIAKEAGHLQPLLIGVDQENGLVSAFTSTPKTEAGTQFPGAMAIAATGSPELAEQISVATGRELRMVGINWAYSPVADVNSDPRNPVIGVRSFGEDPQTVSSFACAVARGLTSAGIAPCAKHFPGHGDTHVDSHLALPVITKDLPALEKTELVPFRALAGAHVASIMTGHMALPTLIASLGADPEDEGSPASLSRGVTTVLLREKLGYAGVIVTDCLEMNAISETYGCGPGAVRALQAGADVVMICHRIDRQLSALEAAYAAVEKSTLNVEALNAGGGRVRSMKDKFAGRWEDVLGRSLDFDELGRLKRENALLSRRAYARATGWLTKTGARISPHADVLVLTPHMESVNAAVDDPEEGVQYSPDGVVRNTAGPSYLAFATAIGRRAPFSSHIVYGPSDAAVSNADGGLSGRIRKSILSAHTVVFTTRNAHQSTSVWQMEVLNRVMGIVKTGSEEEKGKAIKVIVVASCAPYDLRLLESEELTKDLPCICTYEFTRPALEAAAAILYGEDSGRMY